jgi:glycosyltransferase involved in cell wall biosynthesis
MVNTISIVTPSFNQGPFIEEAILSVSQQHYPSVEHIVIDGGSTDGTIEVLKKYPHLNWLSEPDGGQSDAMNKGFARANGDIIGWLNADDTYLPNTFEVVVRFFQNHPDVALAYGYVYVIDDRSRRVRKRITPDYDFGMMLRLGECYAQPTFFFRRSVLEQVGFLDLSLRQAMDYDFILRVGLELKIRKIATVLGSFRTHSGSMSHSIDSGPRMRELGLIIQSRYASFHPTAYPPILYYVKDKIVLYSFKLWGRMISLPLLLNYSIIKYLDHRRKS